MESDPPFEVVIPIPVPVPVPDDDLIAEIERLRAELAAAIKQRDEAWREVCDMVARTRRKTGIRGQIVGLDRVTPAEIAAERGWDCFAKKQGGGA